MDKWTKLTKRKTSFNLIQNELLECVASMGLDWCKVLSIESEWVSDSYLAFGRIIEYYCNLLDSSEVDPEYIELDKELD